MLQDGTESVYRSIARVCCTIQSIVMICRFTVSVTYFVLACLSAVCLLFTFFCDGDTCCVPLLEPTGDEGKRTRN